MNDGKINQDFIETSRLMCSLVNRVCCLSFDQEVFTSRTSFRKVIVKTTHPKFVVNKDFLFFIFFETLTFGDGMTSV